MAKNQSNVERTSEVSRRDSTDPRKCPYQGITCALLQHVGAIAESCGATAIFVYVDAMAGNPLRLPDGLRDRVWYVTKTPEEERQQEDLGAKHLRVPNVPLSRMSQVKIAIFLALSRGLIRRGDKIVFLTGMAGSGSLDTVVVVEVGREYEIFRTVEADENTPSHVLPEVLDRVIGIASELGAEGREGRPVGAIFVIGDTESVLPLTRQLILNPFRGYSEQERNILDASLAETIKELSTIDGAFILRGNGVIETCGSYLKIAGQEEQLPRGLGARHHSAAGITSITDSVAVTVSESTGTVTIFRGGSIITEIEKSRAPAQGRFTMP